MFIMVNDSTRTQVNINLNAGAITRSKLPVSEDKLRFRGAKETAGKRQNLVIVAHGRSGSSFIGNIFNNHPSVFYLFEPYQTVERLQGGVKPYDKLYQEKAREWMSALFQCRFVTPDHVRDLHYYYRTIARENNPPASIALSSPPLCPRLPVDVEWQAAKGCPPLDQETLENTCQNMYNMTVVKVLLGRMPGTSIEQLLSTCESDKFDCKVLFLVRDPRGVIPSSRAVRFFREAESMGLPRTRIFSYENCRQTELNLQFIKTLPPRWKKRIKIFRYEELAVNPLKELPNLLEFAGLPMHHNLTKWVYLASHRPSSEGDRRASPWRQDSAEGADRWRWKVHPYDISIIEKYCGHVMKLLGYRALNQSYELQRNLTVRLLEDNYEAMRWLKDT